MAESKFSSRAIGSQPFGKFELEHRIATGGMAEIYLARSSAFGGVEKYFAIKRILSNLSADEYFVNMFIDEARICVDLNHANIIKTYDFGDVEGVYYIAMEFIDGLDALTLLQVADEQNIRVPPAISAYIIRAACRGLHAAHTLQNADGVSLEVVHRDVSPQNILIGKNGTVKVTDFGIASAKDRISQTQEGTLKGKCGYMSPEQATSGILDHRSDIWAAGVVLWELLASDRLFLGETPMKTMEKVCRMTVPSLLERFDDVDEELDQIVQTALSRNLKKRYQTASDFAVALDTYLEKQNINEAVVSEFISSHTWTSDENEESTRQFDAPKQTHVLSQASAEDERWITEPKAQSILRELETDPNIWHLVRLGNILIEEGQVDIGVASIRLASILYTARGLLVQALCAFHHAAQHMSDVDLSEDLLVLSRLRQRNRRVFEQAVARADAGGLWSVVQHMFDENEAAAETSIIKPTPLFSALSAPAFLKLSKAVSIQNVAAGEVVIQEGTSGDSLFAVGQGRVMVHCQPGLQSQPMVGTDEKTAKDKAMPQQNALSDKVFLSSLTEGDFFGEFSYLTRAQRSATVQAHDDCIVLEIQPHTARELLETDPSFTMPLLEFYKERVGHLLMAKHPVFGIMSSEQRRRLLTHSVVRKFNDRDFVVKEGDTSTEVYFVKRGELEVFREENGIPIFINKLSEGDFFGEFAAIQKAPRMAHVQAMCEVEVICFPAEELFKVFEQTPQVFKQIKAEIESRQIETTACVEQTLRIFSST